MNSNWDSHNHGPAEGRGLDCGEKPIGWCVRLAKDAEVADLRAEVERMRAICIPITDLVQELQLARTALQRARTKARQARAEGWQEGFDRAEYMAHCWGHTDNWGEEDPYPANPYADALAGPEPDPTSDGAP